MQWIISLSQPQPEQPDMAAENAELFFNKFDRCPKTDIESKAALKTMRLFAKASERIRKQRKEFEKFD